MENLLALQSLELDTKPRTLEHEAEVIRLREKVPPQIIDHFDRLIVRGKRGVAIARDGACSECHLRVTSGTQASLSYSTELHRCDNCGRYLYLPEKEQSDPTVSTALTEPQRKPPATRTPKKKAERSTR